MQRCLARWLGDPLIVGYPGPCVVWMPSVHRVSIATIVVNRCSVRWMAALPNMHSSHRHLHSSHSSNISFILYQVCCVAISDLSRMVVR